MRKWWFAFLMILIFVSSVSAQSVSSSDFKVTLIDAIIDYLTAQPPKAPKLTVAELKDLIVVYFTAHGDIIDLSGTGKFSGEKIVDIYNKFKGTCDDCVKGERICSGSNAYQECVVLEYEGYSCTKWKTYTCPSDQTCSNGQCVATKCTDECSTNGIRICSGNGYQTCGNYDSDSCLDWSNVTACPSGQTCSRGVCAAAQPAALPDTTENIHLGLAFNRYVSEPSSLIGKVDYIWGATKNVPGIYMDAYLPYDRDLYTRTLEKWNETNPDWIVYKCDKTTPAWEFNKIAVPLDTTNPAVQDFQLQEFNRYLSGTRYPGISAYSGVGWDNVITGNSFGRCGIWRNGTWVPLYGGQGVRDDPLFRAAVVDWAQTMYTKVKAQFPGKGVTMNLNYDAYATDLYPYLDICLHEGGFTSFGTKLVADTKWLSTVQNFELLNSMNKAFFILNLYQAPDDASVTQSQVNWAIANYLMVKGSHSYMIIYSVYNSTYSYGSFYDRPEYHVQIGHPISARYSYQNVQRRDYSNGLVLVNPSSVKTYTVALPTAYIDIYGTKRSIVTLAPTTAIVLLGRTADVHVFL